MDASTPFKSRRGPVRSTSRRMVQAVPIPAVTTTANARWPAATAARATNPPVRARAPRRRAGTNAGVTTSATAAMPPKTSLRSQDSRMLPTTSRVSTRQSTAMTLNREENSFQKTNSDAATNTSAANDAAKRRLAAQPSERVARAGHAHAYAGSVSGSAHHRATARS